MRDRSYLFFPLLIILASHLISCNTSQEITYWDVIDQNSVLVFETVHPPPVTEKSILPFLKVSSASFAVALQNISKSDYDLIYTYTLQEKEYATLLSNNTLKQPNQKIANRLYSGFEIKELRDNTNKVVLAFTYIRGVFVISESSFLIENAIRVFENKERINFRTKNKSLFQFASIKSDAGNLFVNISHLSLSTLVNSQLKESVPILQDLAESSVLDVKVDSQFISMNGFTLDSARGGLGLSTFQDQKAIKFGMARFIPNYSNSLIYYGVSDLKRFSQSVNDSSLVKINFQDELAVCSINEEQRKFIIIIKLANQDVVDFDSEKYSESYSGYSIRSLKRGLSKSFNQLVPRDTFDFFTTKEDYVFLSKDIDDLKSLIDAIESDDTWGKSLAFQQFYERGLQESNVSLFFRDLMFPVDAENKKWKPLIDSLQLSSISWASIQFSALDNHFYTSVNLATSSKGEKSSGKRKTSGSFRLQNSIAAGFPVKNHSNGISELILQDSTFRISLFSSDNGTLWQYQLDAKILAAHQIDYFKNGKLQYLITTPNSLYLIDRLGRNVKEFPKKLSFNVRHSTVVDYDKSKNYRYLLSSGSKEIYILDKDAIMLDGWSPNRLPFEMDNYSPVHYKIGNKDYFLVISKDKTLHLINRKGDFEMKFHLKLNPFAGDYFVETGSTMGSSFIYTVSHDGVAGKQSFDGTSKSQENLIKGNGSKFLLKKVLGKADFYFLRIDIDKIAVFNKLNQLVFERQNPGSTSLIPSVVSLPQGNSIFCFYDTEQKLSYLYDQIGNPAINRPLESTIAPVFGNDVKNKKLFIYSFSDEIITTTQLN